MAQAQPMLIQEKTLIVSSLLTIKFPTNRPMNPGY